MLNSGLFISIHINLSPLFIINFGLWPLFDISHLILYGLIFGSFRKFYSLNELILTIVGYVV